MNEKLWIYPVSDIEIAKATAYFTGLDVHNKLKNMMESLQISQCDVLCLLEDFKLGWNRLPEISSSEISSSEISSQEISSSEISSSEISSSEISSSVITFYKTSHFL